jgi:hypothetical protein
MLGSAVAQLSFATSVALGVPFVRWALDHLVAAALATQHEFGTIGEGATELVAGPPWMTRPAGKCRLAGSARKHAEDHASGPTGRFCFLPRAASAGSILERQYRPASSRRILRARAAHLCVAVRARFLDE